MASAQNNFCFFYSVTFGTYFMALFFLDHAQEVLKDYAFFFKHLAPLEIFISCSDTPPRITSHQIVEGNGIESL